MSAVASDVLSQLTPGASQQFPPVVSLAGIVFDVPDVFYDATLWRRWLFQLLVRMQILADYDEFHTRWERQLSDVHCGRREFGEALQAFLLNYGLSWAQIDEIEAASRIQRQALEVDVRPLPGVASTIRALNQLRVPMVAWADVPLTGAKLAERLERIFPRAEFQAVVTSFEVECTQPDGQCYRIMGEVFAASSGKTLYVGHDPVHLTAAREAGLLTAALSYLPAGEVDFPLPRLEELAEIASSRRPAAVRCPVLVPRSQIELTASRQGECR
jgi:FMN phosphatase YigB (HAD superfamily)